MSEDPATQTSRSRTTADSRPREVAGGVGSAESGRPTAEKDTPEGSSRPSDAPRPVALSARINFWSTLLTGLAAIIALVLSLITYWQVNSRAEISMAMPNSIQFWSDQSRRQSKLNVVIKPAFNVDKKTDVAAGVMDASVRLEPPTDANQQPMTLRWMAFVELRDDPDKTVLTRVWRGIAEPFLVTQDAREERAMEFSLYAPSDKLNIVAGRWNATLTVQRLDQGPLIRSFCLNIPDDIAGALNDGIKKKDGWSDVQYLNDATPNPPQTDAEEQSGDCYEAI
jgi:hypothetical protein